jgi:hypothetical protein
MSIESTIERVRTLSAALADPALLAETQAAASATGGAAAPAADATGAQSGSFAQALQQASLQQGAGLAPGAAETSGLLGGAGATPGSAASEISAATLSSGALAGASGVPGATGAGGSTGQRIVAIAESQAGQAEEPLGSNEGQAIAKYRSATAGAIPGAPWCAYFASWVARQAGLPLGSNGQGLGSVSEIWSWAQSVGRAIPNGPGVVPKPGDLIVFGGEHVGIVRSVLPNGKIATIEGNYENKVALNERSSSEPTGYVEMN